MTLQYDIVIVIIIGTRESIKHDERISIADSCSQATQSSWDFILQLFLRSGETTMCLTSFIFVNIV